MTDLLTENARLRAALEKALNYIENTESELGITLDCGDAARAALATPAPDAVQEAARVTTAQEIVDAALRAIAAEKARADAMEGALRFYADENRHSLPSDGPWGLGSTDFGAKARAALAQHGKVK